MKIFLTALSLSLCILAYPIDEISITRENHRLYIEPDFSWNLTQEYKNDVITFKKWGQYYGVSAGYEFSKPDSLYANLEALVSIGSRYGEWKDQYENVANAQEAASKNRIDASLGYTIDANKLTLTPFTGGGAFFLNQTNSYLNLTYVPLGIKAEYKLKNMSIGLKGVQLRYIHKWQKDPDSYESSNIWGAEDYGYEISIPISFKAGEDSGNWSGALEPYYLKIFDSLTFVGGRISAIHQF